MDTGTHGAHTLNPQVTRLKCPHLCNPAKFPKSKKLRVPVLLSGGGGVWGTVDYAVQTVNACTFVQRAVLVCQGQMAFLKHCSFLHFLLHQSPDHLKSLFTFCACPCSLSLLLLGFANAETFLCMKNCVANQYFAQYLFVVFCMPTVPSQDRQ